MRKSLAATLIAAAAASTVALAPAAQAAGGNVQLEFYDNKHNTSHVCVQGNNQSGSYVGNCWDTPGAQTPLSGWWWQIGSCVTIQGYDQSWNQLWQEAYRLGGSDGGTIIFGDAVPGNYC
ncbi:hypothetical protein [Kitasatospora cineracea]|uniref:hypothetical protein n=1 Tax=Kitasatospora cineracea TaxID=88074 RepID=UPI00379EFE99